MKPVLGTGPLDSRTMTKTNTRFDCPFLAKTLRKFTTGRLMLLFVGSVRLYYYSFILIVGN